MSSKKPPTPFDFPTQMAPPVDRRQPAWWRAGFLPAGPGRCRCRKCGATISTNAFARSKHRCLGSV